ncbi:hypothetical protein [Aeromicrobium sp. Root472D3]|uniref:hypothetical protein n=1 Tax=Aeromicrobium sp. Root472D3 TaxID=1736540 RepID=UPI0007004585|nr:hypothetical protein [Aeromicrobium sp. Root472D3]KQX75486.1 hypothetical protein ASD10_10065 [Aeromicrobium sp. Root472D3]
MSVLTAQRPPAVDDRRERRAIGWLTLGLLLGPIGLTVGWYHVLTAPRWSWRDKLAAALLPLPLAGARLAMRAELDVPRCRQSADGSVACTDSPLSTILGWVVPIVMLVVLAVMIRHLRRSARRLETHPVTSAAAALALAVVAAWCAPVVVDTVEDTWSHRQQDAVLDAAADADRAGEAYTVIGEDAQSDWTSDVARPDEREAERLVGAGNRRFDRLFEELAAETDEDGEWSISAAGRRRCHVFPVVPSGDAGDVQDVTALVRLCYGAVEGSASLTLDAPR